MRVEITEEKILDGHDTRHLGDQITVPDDKGLLWVTMGWAKNLDSGEQNARNLTPQIVTETPIVQGGE